MSINHSISDSDFLDSLLDLLEEEELKRKESSIQILEKPYKVEEDDLIEDILSLTESHHTQKVLNEERYPVSRVEVHRLCHICGEKAGKHVYYGGQCCPSCRAFFRRSVQNYYFKHFSCSSKKGACKINLQTRKSCQYCRFQKCLAAGMKVSWVLPDGERNSKKLLTLKLPTLDGGGLTLKELSVVGDIKKRLFRQVIKNFSICIQQNPFFLYDFASFMRSPKDFDSSFLVPVLNVSQIDFYSIIDMALDDDDRLDENDRQVIYQNNYSSVCMFRQACTVESPGCPNVEEVTDCLKSLKIEEDERIISRMPGNAIFTLNHLLPFVSWQSQNETQCNFVDATYRMKRWANDQDSTKDETLYILMIFIIFFDTDFIDLEDLQQPKIIEKTRLKYVYMLSRYLKKKYPKTQAKMFIEAVMIPSVAREAYELLKRIS